MSANHVFVWRAQKCAWCKRRTHWIEINFECALHRGRCTERMDDEYFKALET